MNAMLSSTTITDGQRLIFLPQMASHRLSPATKVMATTYYYYGAHIEQSTLCAQKPTKCMKHQKQHRRCRRAARALALIVVSLPQRQVCDATVNLTTHVARFRFDSGTRLFHWIQRSRNLSLTVANILALPARPSSTATIDSPPELQIPDSRHALNVSGKSSSRASHG
jgi:hypothetical protein